VTDQQAARIEYAAQLIADAIFRAVYGRAPQTSTPTRTDTRTAGQADAPSTQPGQETRS